MSGLALRLRLHLHNELIESFETENNYQNTLLLQIQWEGHQGQTQCHVARIIILQNITVKDSHSRPRLKIFV